MNGVNDEQLELGANAFLKLHGFDDLTEWDLKWTSNNQKPLFK